MAKPPPPEIDKAKIKKLLRKSKPTKPMNCAVGIGNDGTAVIYLDKLKKKQAALKEAEKEYGEISSGRFGEAFVDKDVDRKLVILSLNRALSGIARKLKKTLKGTGFAKVQVMVDGKVAEEVMEVDPDDEIENDDDNDFDDEDDDDEDTGSGQIRGPEVLEDEPEPVTSSQPPPAPPQPPAATAETQPREAPAEPGIDFKALTDQLSKAVRKMIAFADDAERFKQLRAMAEQAQAAIKATRDEAVELVYELEAALEDGASAPPAESAAAPPAAPPPPPQSATPETAPAANTEGVDFKDLTAQLTSLVKRLVPIRAANPETFASIMTLVAKAQAAIKATQDEAVEAVYEVDAAVTAAEEGGAPNAATADASGTTADPPAAPPPPPADPAKEAALGASPKLWTDTMASVAGGINQLKDAIRRDLGSEAPEVLADVERNLGKIDAVTSRFDRALADLLQGAAAATDAASRQAQLKQARTVLADHIKYASTEPLIGLIDQNPFGVATNIKSTLVSNLTQLAAVMR